ncbi:MAG: TRAM domain-containing protein, partial [Campylobacterota bacterium]|nr:TRAM domain-containing protein [Campylobacterota bacterium]
HMDDEFIAQFASNPKISKQIHVPLQSGSTSVLKSMKRGYTKEWFLNRCAKIKELVPDVRISTDIIVGFPGETHEDFLDTMDVINQVRFDQIFNFKYSPRPETAALNMTNTVDDQIASKRLIEVIELHKIHQEENLAAFVGQTMNLFVEELRSNGEVFGYTDNYCPVFIKGSEELLGQFIDVKIISSTRTTLKGEII